VRQQRGDLAGAERALRESLPILHGLRSKSAAAWCLDALAAIAAAQGHAERAARLAGAAEALRRDQEDATALDAAVALGLEVVDA
jgi:non-specific serine/threonine protein kinase